jgi:tRNA(fMet)-specific endonuclease VapC
MYLLDTNGCVEHLRQRPTHVAQRIAATPFAEMRLCSVVKAELYYGARRSARPQENLAKVQAFVQQFISLPFDDVAAEVYADIRAQLEAQGRVIGPNDLMIAAIALTHNLTLVTSTTSEFSRVPGLRLENWQTPPPP